MAMAKSSKNGEDRLSMLPLDVRYHILSLMPTKFAVRTSILSKKWRYSWIFLTNLDFDDIHPFHGNKILSKFVNQVMKFCKSPQIQLFRLHFFKAGVRKSSVSNWIDKAVRLNVRELDIDVIEPKLPSSMFTCKTLTKLRLNRSIFDKSAWECPSSVYLPCLKTLDICDNISFVNAFKLIRGCPMLESLSLEVVCHCNDVNNYIFNIPSLKRLILTLPDDYPSHKTKVVLHVPNLEYLFVGGVLRSSFIMEDLSSLVEACVSFSDIRVDHMWVELIEGLSGVKTLSVQNFPSTKFHLPIFPNMERLELKRFRNSGVVTQFLESCPALKHLSIKEKQAFAWVESKLAPDCMLTNLTTIKFSICKRWRYDIPFLEYMLGNAEVLKTITITWKYSSNVEQETRLCEKLLKIHRASRCCEIRFHGSWSHSTISFRISSSLLDTLMSSSFGTPSISWNKIMMHAKCAEE